MKRAVIVLVALVALAPRGASTAGTVVADDRRVSQAGHADRSRRGEEGRAHRVDRLRARAAQRLHRGRAGIHAGASSPASTKDDGIELSDISISDDGSIVMFVRGTAPNREGWVANPTADPAGADANDLGGAHRPAVPTWKLGEGTTPALVAGRSDGRVREGRSDLRYPVR